MSPPHTLKVFLSVLTATLLLNGCSTNYGLTYAEKAKSQTEIPPNSFRVTFFRLDDTHGIRSARIRIDDDKKLFVHVQSFTSVELSAEKHLIRTDMTGAPFTAVCKYEISPNAGEHWYYLIRPTPPYTFGLVPALLPLSIYGMIDAYSRGGGCGGDFFATRINPNEAQQKIQSLREALD